MMKGTVFMNLFNWVQHIKDFLYQPMQYEHLEIIYNGEVYNFKEIREELEKDDYTFESDTEVLIKSYHKFYSKINRYVLYSNL